MHRGEHLLVGVAADGPVSVPDAANGGAVERVDETVGAVLAALDGDVQIGARRVRRQVHRSIGGDPDAALVDH